MIWCKYLATFLLEQLLSSEALICQTGIINFTEEILPINSFIYEQDTTILCLSDRGIYGSDLEDISKPDLILLKLFQGDTVELYEGDHPEISQSKMVRHNDEIYVSAIRNGGMADSILILRFDIDLQLQNSTVFPIESQNGSQSTNLLTQFNKVNNNRLFVFGNVQSTIPIPGFYVTSIILPNLQQESTLLETTTPTPLVDVGFIDEKVIIDLHRSINHNYLYDPITGFADEIVFQSIQLDKPVIRVPASDF